MQKKATGIAGPLAVPGDRAEGRLLLTSAQLLWDPTRIWQIEAILQNDIKWDDVVEQALFHGVLPVLYKGLSRGFLAAIPPDIMETLRATNLQIAVSNLKLTHELIQVLVQFRQNGIQAIPLKGPCLADSLYGSVLLRQFQDLDILVQMQDASKARELLVSQGYIDQDGLSSHEEPRRLADDCEFHLYHPARHVFVEIHWRILPHQTFDSEFLWSHPAKSSIGGIDTLTLPLEELFLVLALHGGDKHDWTSLRWICDLALLTVNSSIDWERLLCQARFCGAQRCVLRAVSVVHQIFGIALPKQLEKECLRRSYRAYAALVRGRLFHRDAALPGFREWRYYFITGGPDNPRLPSGMLRICAHLFDYLRVITEPRFNDRCQLPLPRRLSLAYYFVRAFRLAQSQGWNLPKRLF